MKKKSRIIVDTNLWISFLISNNFSHLDKIISSNQSIILFSQELLEEFIQVSRRPKLIKYFGEQGIESFLDIIDEVAEFINVTSEIKFLKDSKDDFLLSLAVDGKADYLITGDKELIEVKKYISTEIITMSDFILKYDL